ncbi:MAG: glycosyltransferase family 4 protein [Candidatus Omnitrophica bacterium]|nr:glycosyltransferase family 4 protein [Candidatus Omnitrophota bacterium]
MKNKEDNKKIKILFIITYLELGGAQKHLLSLIKNLDRKKYFIYLCSSPDGYLREKFFRLPDLNLYFIPELKREISFIRDFQALLKIYLYIKNNRFDIVHVHSPKASFIGRWAAYFAGVRKIVYTVHGWPFHKYMPLVYYNLFLFIEKITSKITQNIILVSQADVATGLKNKILSKGKFCLIHYGIETKSFEKAWKKRRLNQISHTIITISSFKPQKNMFCFLEMVRLILKNKQNVKFIVLGEGPLKGEVQNKVDSMGLSGKVILEGWVDDVADLFRDSSIFVLTSLWEGLPVSLIEAVISGVPVVVTNTGGVFDIVIENKQGLIVEPLNAVQMSKSCLQILNSYKDWEDKIRKNRELMNVFYWSDKRMMGLTEKFYK